MFIFIYIYIYIEDGVTGDEVRFAVVVPHATQPEMWSRHTLQFISIYIHVYMYIYIYIYMFIYMFVEDGVGSHEARFAVVVPHARQPRGRSVFSD